MIIVVDKWLQSLKHKILTEYLCSFKGLKLHKCKENTILYKKIVIDIENQLKKLEGEKNRKS